MSEDGGHIGHYVHMIDGDDAIARGCQASEIGPFGNIVDQDGDACRIMAQHFGGCGSFKAAAEGGILTLGVTDEFGAGWSTLAENCRTDEP